MPRRKRTTEEIFWSHVNKNGPTQPHCPELGPCWEWTGELRGFGYGCIWISSTEREMAHRVSWRLFVGPIPEGKRILHKCDNRKCVRPSHLFEGTQLDNMRDKFAKGRANMLRGEDQPNSKLSEKEVLEIRALAANGMTQQAIADKFGVIQQCVQLIVTRKRWKHI